MSGWRASRGMYMKDLLKSVKPILHYASGLRVGKVCEQKPEKDLRKTREKCNWLAFLPSVFPHVFDTNMLVQKMQGKTRGKFKNSRKN